MEPGKEFPFNKLKSHRRMGYDMEPGKGLPCNQLKSHRRMGYGTLQWITLQ